MFHTDDEDISKVFTELSTVNVLGVIISTVQMNIFYFW